MLISGATDFSEFGKLSTTLASKFPRNGCQRKRAINYVSEIVKNELMLPHFVIQIKIPPCAAQTFRPFMNFVLSTYCIERNYDPSARRAWQQKPSQIFLPIINCPQQLNMKPNNAGIDTYEKAAIAGGMSRILCSANASFAK